MKIKLSLVLATILSVSSLQASKAEFLLLDSGERKYKSSVIGTKKMSEKTLSRGDKKKLKDGTLDEWLKQAMQDYKDTKRNEFLTKIEIIKDDLDENSKSALASLQQSSDWTEKKEQLKQITSYISDTLYYKYENELNSDETIKPKYDAADKLSFFSIDDNKILIGAQDSDLYKLPLIYYGSDYTKYQDRETMAKDILNQEKKQEIINNLNDQQKLQEWLTQAKANNPNSELFSDQTSTSKVAALRLQKKKDFLNENSIDTTGISSIRQADAKKSQLPAEKQSLYDKLDDEARKEQLITWLNDIKISGIYEEALIGIQTISDRPATMALGSDGNDNIPSLEITYDKNKILITSAQEGKESDVTVFKYITLGDDQSTLTYNLTNESISEFEILDSNANDSITVGKNSNLIIKAENNAKELSVNGIKLGFASASDDLENTLSTPSNASFRLINKGDIKVNEAPNAKIYLNNGSTYELISKEGNINFNNAIETKYKENAQSHNYTFKLESTQGKINNQGIIQARGEGSLVQLTAPEKIQNIGSTVINTRSNLTNGSISALNGGKVVINGDMTNEGKLINIGGEFEVNGVLDSTNGALVLGQSKANSEASLINVSKHAILGGNTKIALALHKDSEPLKGEKSYHILKTKDGIVGVDSIKQDNILIFNLSDINTAEFETNKSIKYIKVSLGDNGDYKNLFYRLALTQEALEKPITEVIKPKDEQENKNANTNLIDKIKRISPTYGVSMYSEYEKAINGDQEAQKMLTTSLQNLDQSIKHFQSSANQKYDIFQTINLTNNINTYNRLAKLSNPAANYFAQQSLINELNDQSYARSLVILSDVEDELVSRLREKKSAFAGSSEPNEFNSNFWFNAIKSKGHIGESRTNLGGFSIGVDTQLDSAIIGAYGLLASSNTKISSNLKTKVKHIQLGAYARFFDQGYELDLSGFYGIDMAKTQRSFQFFNDTLEYNSKANTHNLGFSTSIGMAHALADGLIIKPSLGLNTYIAKTPDVKESGELGLMYDGGISYLASLDMALELRYYVFGGGYFYLVPGLETEMLKKNKTQVRFNSADLGTSEISSPKKTYATIMSGAELSMGQNASFNLGLGAKVSGNDKFYSLNAGVKVKF